MKILCTFSGKFGDILWSLPTVKMLREYTEEKLADYTTEYGLSKELEVHFGIMPQYRSLLPLLQAQSYIDEAFVIENWTCIGSPHGDQPWQPPFSILVDKTYYVTEDIVEGKSAYYDKVYHLTYRQHPAKNQPLIDFIAQQQGIQLNNPIPFIELKGFIPEKTNEGYYHLFQAIRNYPHIAYAFNESMQEVKFQFLEELEKRTEGLVKFVGVSKMPWVEAAWAIDSAIAFLGCRSSNYVLSCGLGQRTFVFEPNVSRSKFGPWGTTFTCPYANETQVSFVNIDQIVTEIKEKINAIATT